MNRLFFPVPLVLGMLVIFLAGGVAGGFIGARMQQSSVQERSRLDHLHGSLMTLFKKKLNLTDEQIETIEPLIAEACDELRVIKDESYQKVEHVILTYHEKIAKELTPEQVVILKAMERERQARGDHFQNASP